MFAFNQGEVCTCPSRALIHESIYDRFMERALARVKAIKQGNPLDTETMLGAQASMEQVEKIMSYIDIGKQEGAKLLTGGERTGLAGELAGGYVFGGPNLQHKLLHSEGILFVREKIDLKTYGWEVP